MQEGKGGQEVLGKGRTTNKHPLVLCLHCLLSWLQRVSSGTQGNLPGATEPQRKGKQANINKQTNLGVFLGEQREGIIEENGFS